MLHKNTDFYTRICNQSPLALCRSQKLAILSLVALGVFMQETELLWCSSSE